MAPRAAAIRQTCCCFNVRSATTALAIYHVVSVQVPWVGSLAPFVQVKLCLFCAYGQPSGTYLPGETVRTEMLEFVSAI